MNTPEVIERLRGKKQPMELNHILVFKLPLFRNHMLASADRVDESGLYHQPDFRGQHRIAAAHKMPVPASRAAPIVKTLFPPHPSRCFSKLAKNEDLFK